MRHQRVHWLGLAASTMDEARALALAGAGHGTAVVAREQSAGRGRGGRAWVSPAGNLHVTIILRPGGDARRAPEMAFVTAVAVAETVDRLAGAGTALKWPNDVMRGGAKLAGILLERLDGGAVLAGVGMNVRHSPPDMPYAVTSLHALGCAAQVEDVLGVLLAELDAGWEAWCREGFAAVLRRWLVRGPAPGAEMVGQVGAETVAGRFAGLREDGALLLDTAAGRRALVAGEVHGCAGRLDVGTNATC